MTLCTLCKNENAERPHDLPSLDEGDNCEKCGRTGFRERLDLGNDLR